MPLFVNQPVDDDDYSCVKLHCSALVPRVLPLWIITLRQRPSFSEGLCYSDIVTVKRLTAAGNWGFFFFVVYVVFSVLKFLQIIFLTFAFASLTNFSQSNKSSWSYIQVFFFPQSEMVIHRRLCSILVLRAVAFLISEQSQGFKVLMISVKLQSLLLWVFKYINYGQCCVKTTTCLQLDC